MPRIPGPQDVPLTPLSNRRRVVQIAANDSGRRVSAVASGGEEILNTARDQQIENEVVSAELRMRGDLDRLRIEMENAGPTSEGDPDIPSMWDERAQQIRERHAGALTAPRARRVWEQRAGALLTQERAGVLQLQQRRTVERARAGLLTSVGEAQNVLTDENATPEARAQALQAIRVAVGRAAQRRIIGSDDAAAMIQGAERNAAEFERERGMRQRAQTEEDRIWAESGGDLNAALNLARDIEEPGLRDMVEDRVAQRYTRQRAAREAAIEGAMGRAYAVIENGGSLEGVARGDREIITQAGQMDTLRNYQRNRAGGVTGEGWTQMTRQSQLVRDRMLGVAADPERARFFARVDLYSPLSEEDARGLGLPVGTVIADHVQMPDDRNALALRQRQLRGEVPVGQGQNTIVDQAFNATIAVARRRAAAMGLNLNYNGTARGAQNDRLREQRAQFESYIFNEVRAYVSVRNALPSQQDMERITTDALRQSRGGGFLGMGVTTRRRFEAGPEARVRVPFANIPEWQVERLARAWAQSGRTQAPTEADIEAMYAEELQSE